MSRHSDFPDNIQGARELLRLIKKGEILFGGNARLRIYGRLHCKSGKRLHRANRVFFATEKEAIQQGFRPCGHCMRKQYLAWKKK